MSENKIYKILKKGEIKNSEIELEIEISQATIEGNYDRATTELGEDLELPGFRKGKAPKDRVTEKVGEMAILEKATYKTINDIVPIVISAEKLDALSQPSITVTKLVPKSPIEFKMKVTLMPEVILPDYKTLAKTVSEIKKQEITDKEVDEYIDYIRKQRAEATMMHENKKIDQDKLELPELNEEFVKSLGDFKDVDEFKKKLKENMLQEKEMKEAQRRRLEIMEKIITEAKIDLPDVLVDQELDQMMHKFQHDIENMKMNFEEYLTALKKTEDDLRKEWKPDAEKRTKMNLLLPKIADAEKLKPKDDEIKKEVEHLKEHHKDISDAHATMYVANVLTNEEVFKFLEEVK